MAKILVVDDDKDLCGFVCDALEFDGHVVEASHEGDEALTRLALSSYDTIVLDLDLPRVSGIDICKKLRRDNVATPIIMLTGRDTTDDKLTGLDSGADDYLTKPFEVKELCARVRALLRRSSGSTGDVLKVGEVVLDPVQYMVTVRGQELKLLPKEFQLLQFLMRHPGRVFSHDALLSQVWNLESDATDEAIRSCMKRLRKKLEEAAAEPLIETVHRVGYRLKTK
ncbi:MAG: response regulator transcription factor [Candidatus Obscuribacterales bacterium]